MSRFHFLNVKEGDCSIIEHLSGHVTVIDVCNASKEDERLARMQKAITELGRIAGNFNQKEYPVNPISYLTTRGVESVFRFILTHPDMDHMDGIKVFFETFGPCNFWDTDNNCEKEDWGNGGQYNEDDWRFYESVRDGKPSSDPKRLCLYAGAQGKYYNEDKAGGSGGDGLYILSPTEELLSDANECGEHNDASYVILYRSKGGRILFAGDSHDKTWDHILANHSKDVRNVDLLIAPHHGRGSERSYKFLDTLNPALTFFGNARSEHLAYNAWSNRSLPIVTNNQANCMVVDTSNPPLKLYVTNKKFAEKWNVATFYSHEHGAYYCGPITR